jgi:hypothetical protein
MNPEKWLWVKGSKGGRFLRKGEPYSEISVAYVSSIGGVGTWYIWDDQKVSGVLLEHRVATSPTVEEAVEQATKEIRKQLEAKGLQIEIETYEGP